MAKKRRSTTKSRRLPPPPGGVPGVAPTITLNKGVEKGYSRTGDANVDQRKKAFLSRRNEGILLLLMLTLIITGAYVAIKFSETKASGGGLRDIIQKGGVREEDGVITNSDGTLTTLAYVLIPLFFILVAGAFVTNWRAIMDWFMGMMPKKIPAPPRRNTPPPTQPQAPKSEKQKMIERVENIDRDLANVLRGMGDDNPDYIKTHNLGNILLYLNYEDLRKELLSKDIDGINIKKLPLYAASKTGDYTITNKKGVTMTLEEESLKNPPKSTGYTYGEHKSFMTK